MLPYPRIISTSSPINTHTPQVLADMLDHPSRFSPAIMTTDESTPVFLFSCAFSNCYA
ncbi:hypothetical protein BDV32DRAFT_54243 [Aspergillus pseudonomiae]|nr:hypothetical protein BDV32DRAFT_54243 [Aspergillus pseudonomiae]